MIKQLLIALFPLLLFAQTEHEPSLALPEMESTMEKNVVLGEVIQASPISDPFAEPIDEAPPLLVKKTKSPFVASLLSSLVPGSGHYYLGDYRVASELLGSTLLGGMSVYATRNDPALLLTSVFTTQGIAAYSVYAAYRDTHLYNGTPSPFMPRDDLKNLAAAPFQWSILKKPEVWGGILGALTLGTIAAYLSHADEAYARINTTYITPLIALPVAIGEESIFRGLIQTSLLEKLPPWGAITLSSLAFGAAHIPNALTLERSRRWNYYAVSLPLITSFGAYMGWLTYKNRSLKESVAIHAWYDFTVFSLAVLANKAMIGEKTQMYCHSWAF